MLWQSLANDVRLGEEVVDVMLKAISQGQDEQSQGAGSCQCPHSHAGDAQTGGGGQCGAG